MLLVCISRRGCSSALAPAIALLQLQYGNSSCPEAFHAWAQLPSNKQSCDTESIDSATTAVCRLQSSLLLPQQQSSFGVQSHFLELVNLAVQQQAAFPPYGSKNPPLDSLQAHRQSQLAVDIIGTREWFCQLAATQQLPHQHPSSRIANSSPDEISLHYSLPAAGVDPAAPLLCVKRTYQPHPKRYKRKHGFLKRMSTESGRKIVRRRQAKGHWRISA